MPKFLGIFRRQGGRLDQAGARHHPSPSPHSASRPHLLGADLLSLRHLRDGVHPHNLKARLIVLRVIIEPLHHSGQHTTVHTWIPIDEQIAIASHNLARLISRHCVDSPFRYTQPVHATQAADLLASDPFDTPGAEVQHTPHPRRHVPHFVALRVRVRARVIISRSFTSSTSATGTTTILGLSPR